jgi:hypothetical protein
MILNMIPRMHADNGERAPRAPKMFLDFLLSGYDDVCGRAKTAFPTRYHYIECVSDALARRNISVSNLGQHCIVLKDIVRKKELIVAVRYATDRDLKLISKRKDRAGSTVAFLIDDDYWAMLENEKLAPDYHARLRGFLFEQYPRMQELIDVVVSPSQQILSRIPEITGYQIEPAHMCPSGDLTHFERTSKRVDIVFLGTSTHRGDFQRIVPGIARALDRNSKLHLTTLLGKHGNKDISEGSQVTHLGDKFFPFFQAWLRNQRFHIGLAPYEPNPTNDARSNLKCHQYAMVGAAGLYSPTQAFRSSVKHGDTGMLIDFSPTAWEEAIVHLAANTTSMKQIALASAANSRSLGDHDRIAASWLQVLESE